MTVLLFCESKKGLASGLPMALSAASGRCPQLSATLSRHWPA